MLKLGAPWLLDAVLLWLLVNERKRKDELVNRLYDLGLEVVKSNSEVNAWLSRMEKSIDEIQRKT